MSYTFAGQYGAEQMVNSSGAPLANTAVNVYTHGTTTAATLYTDRTKATKAANPVTTDSVGNLIFWADPGQYDLTISGLPTTNTVLVPSDPSETSVISATAVGGDVSGTISAETVAKIEGTAVSATAPTTSQVLIYNGTDWAPETQVFDVKAYGAKGDGTTDDTTAINDAIAAATTSGGIVYFPPGTYHLGTAPKTGPSSSTYCLEIPSSVYLWLSTGSTLKIANSLDAGVVLMATSATNCGVIGGGIIDGNQANQTDGGTDGAQCGIYGSALQYCTFDVQVQNCIRQGFYLSNSSWGHAKITALSNGTSSNTLAGVEDDANNDFVFDVLARSNNGPGFHMVGGASLSDNHVIARVISYGNQYGILGNYAQGSQVVAICQANTTDGALLENCDGCDISGYFDGNNRHGIYDYQGSNNRLRITARNNNHGAASGGVGINLYGTTNAVVDAPRCYDDQGTTTQVYGIQTDSTATGSVIGGSLLGYGTGAATSLGGTGVLFHNVAGYNPVGSVTVSVPASGTAVAAVGYDRTFYVTTASGTTSCTLAVENGPTVTAIASTAQVLTVFVPAGKTLTPTYAGTAPTWVVEGN